MALSRPPKPQQFKGHFQLWKYQGLKEGRLVLIFAANLGILSKFYHKRLITFISDGELGHLSVFFRLFIIHYFNFLLGIFYF